MNTIQRPATNCLPESHSCDGLHIDRPRQRFTCLDSRGQGWLQKNLMANPTRPAICANSGTDHQATAVAQCARRDGNQLDWWFAKRYQISRYPSDWPRWASPYRTVAGSLDRNNGNVMGAGYIESAVSEYLIEPPGRSKTLEDIAMSHLFSSAGW